MTPEEVAGYEDFVMDTAYGAGRITCFLCREIIAAGEKCLWIPGNCEDTSRRDAGQPYHALPAHRHCIENVP
jgi:hypothetical protein